MSMFAHASLIRSPLALAAILALAGACWLVQLPRPAAPLAGARSGRLPAQPVGPSGGTSGGPSRRVRQQRTILAAFARGEVDRATLLATEHLREFPDDDIVRGELAANSVR